MYKLQRECCAPPGIVGQRSSITGICYYLFYMKSIKLSTHVHDKGVTITTSIRVHNLNREAFLGKAKPWPSFSGKKIRNRIRIPKIFKFQWKMEVGQETCCSERTETNRKKNSFSRIQKQRPGFVKDSIEICSKCVGLCQLLNFYLEISSGAAVKLE